MGLPLLHRPTTFVLIFHINNMGKTKPAPGGKATRLPADKAFF